MYWLYNCLLACLRYKHELTEDLIHILCGSCRWQDGRDSHWKARLEWLNDHELQFWEPRLACSTDAKHDNLSEHSKDTLLIGKVAQVCNLAPGCPGMTRLSHVSLLGASQRLAAQRRQNG